MADFICLHTMSFNHSCITHGVIEWSDDDRIAVIHDQGIYILKLCSSMGDVTSSFKVEVTLVPNILQEHNFNIGIDPSIFCDDPIAFPEFNSFAYDRVLNHNKCLFNSMTSFSSAKWSPPGFSEDGRCVLATVAFNHNLDIHTLQEYIGKWKVEIDLSEQLYDDCKKDNFKKITFKQLNAEYSSLRKEAKTFHIYKSRLYYLATMAICWCPFLVTNDNYFPQDCTPEAPGCASHASGCASDASDCATSASGCATGASDCAPTPPKKTKMTTKIITALLATTNKAGFIIIWKISKYLHSDKISASLLHEIGTGKEWGSSINWYQASSIEPGYLAVANTDGCIDVYVFRISNEEDKLNWMDIQTYKLWTDVDEILINKAEWILQENQNDKQLTLVVAKGTNILIFKFSIEKDGKIQKHSLLFGPCLHQTPITSLSIRSNGYVATSGLDGLVQCFLLDDLSARLLTTGCREGSTCCGLGISRDSLMIIALHSPFKMLLLQNKFIKQMDIVFVPLITLSNASKNFIQPETRISSEYREFFRISVNQGIQLDNSLYELSKQPISVDTSCYMLQKIAFLKWLIEFVEVRAEKEKAKEMNIGKTISPILMKYQEFQQIEKILWEKSMQNILSNAMQFIECGMSLSQDDIKTILLAADWIVSEGNRQREFQLALKLFEHLGHVKSIETGNFVWDRRRGERDNNVTNYTSSPSTPYSNSIHDNNVTKEASSPSIPSCSKGERDNNVTKGSNSPSTPCSNSERDNSMTNGACSPSAPCSKIERENNVTVGTSTPSFSNSQPDNNMTKCASSSLCSKSERDNNLTEGASLPSTPSCSKSELGNNVTKRASLSLTPFSKNNLIMKTKHDNDTVSFKETTKDLNTVNDFLSFINQMPCRERCPVCQDDVPFNRFDIGKCNKGHSWNRCSLTLQICVDLYHRKCVTCLKRSKTKIYNISNSVLNKYLLNIDFCPFCNGRLTNPLT